MAKKKEEKRSFGQMPLPSGRKRYKTVRKAWNGINEIHTNDSGCLSCCRNMSTRYYPNLSSEGFYDIDFWDKDPANAKPISMQAFDNFLIIVYFDYNDSSVKLDYVKLSKGEFQKCYTGILKTEADESEVYIPRCVVQFNVLDDTLDPVASGVTKKLIILPDKKSMDFEITNPVLDDDGMIPLADLEVETIKFTNDSVSAKDGGDPVYLKNTLKADRRYVYQNEKTGDCYEWFRDTEAGVAEWQWTQSPVFPSIDYGVVSHGRLFGVGRGRIYASGFNNYANWTFDTVEEYNEANAWCSSVHANTKADGEFTGITSYGGNVIAFKKDMMYEIYNTKNPFRVIDLCNEGTVDNRSICEVNGALFFATETDIKMYNGSNVVSIGKDLKLGKIDCAAAAGDGRNYYVAIHSNLFESTVYVYDTHCGQWTMRDSYYYSNGVAGFCSSDSGIYLLTDNRCAGRLVNDYYGERYEGYYESENNCEWDFKTDVMSCESLDIKHLKTVRIKVRVKAGTHFMLSVRYYRDGEWGEADHQDGEFFEEEVMNFNSDVYDEYSYKDHIIRLTLRKSAAPGVMLKLSGYGYVRFHAMELIYEDGGEMTVSDGGDNCVYTL